MHALLVSFCNERCLAKLECKVLKSFAVCHTEMRSILWVYCSLHDREGETISINDANAYATNEVTGADPGFGKGRGANNPSCDLGVIVFIPVNITSYWLSVMLFKPLQKS